MYGRAEQGMRKGSFEFGMYASTLITLCCHLSSVRQDTAKIKNIPVFSTLPLDGISSLNLPSSIVPCPLLLCYAALA